MALIIGGADGSAPSNPSPRKQVWSRPTVGLSVRVHRRRAQARHKSLPATTRQRVLGPLSGGLVSYGTDAADTHRQVASYVDRILRGTKLEELPVQAPIKFELVINLKAAKALGLEIPPMLLALADEVIEGGGGNL
jgi:hypothetical protein